MKRGLVAVLAIVACSWMFMTAEAAEVRFPTKHIEITVGFPPGGGTDLGARLVAEYAKKALGQDVVVANKPGGAGYTAATLITKAKPDGYSLAATTDSVYILLPNYEKVPYDPLTDFTFISQYGVLNYGLVVRDDSPFRDFKDFIQYARANPDKLTVGTVGVNTENTVAIEVAALQEGVKVKMIPFPGAADAITALMGGHVMAADLGASGYAQYVRSKKVRLLATFGDSRPDSFADAPCLKELGYSFTAINMYVLLGPKGLDRSIAERLADTFVKATQTPEYATLAKNLEIFTKSPMLSLDTLKADIERKNKLYREILKKLGLGLK